MLTTRIEAAFAYAAIAHAGQCRAGTQIPYLSHLMAVASLVMEAVRIESRPVIGLESPRMRLTGTAWTAHSTIRRKSEFFTRTT